MKNTLRKRTFISAIAMLLVSAIVLTSSTFAWFSMAKRVEVENMQLNITSPDGVQISANTSAFTTTLTLEDLMGESTARWNAYEGNTNNFPELLRPSSSNLSLGGSMPKFFEGSINDSGLLSTYSVQDTTGGYVVFDLFVKVGKNETVWWNETTITCDDNPEVVTAMRMAMVNGGTVNEKAEADEIAGAIPGNYTNNRVVMFEPDSTNHTAASGYAASATVPDSYIHTGVTNVAPVAGKYYTTNGAGNAQCIRANENNADSTAYFNAAAGVNRIRVYLWMEGNDVDCANDVAGATIDFNLVLTLK